MKQALYEIGLQELVKYTGIPFSDTMSDGFLCADFKGAEALTFLKDPCRFNGYIAVFCLEGSIGLEINLKRYDVKPNSLIVSVPGHIWRVCEFDTEAMRNLHFLLVAVSGEFLSDLRFDINSLFEDSLAVLDNPCISLDDKQSAICLDYFALADKVALMRVPGVLHSLQLLISSTFCLLASIWGENISKARAQRTSRSSRAKQTFESFYSLVQQYHNEERGVAWYADKLNLTPKYLSRLVREVSGKSAPEWIDMFVIMEAKNQLRYTELPIKAIAANLGFSSPVAFHTFFKSKTGLTPMGYREK